MDMAWEICSYEFASFILGTNVDAICIKKQGDWPGKRKEKLFWAGGAVDGGWGWPPPFWGGRPERGPCCSNLCQKAAVTLPWWRVWNLHIFAAAVPQPLLPPFRSRTGR